MKTPKFYYEKPGLKALLLLPLSIVFWLLSTLRKVFIKPVKLEGKIVICIGNATVGGAGKTPSCVFLGNLLKESGYDICFISRGYGRKTKGFIQITQGLTVNETGDEALILKKTAPVYLFSKYKEIASNLSQIKEKIIIMDDGMQNPSIIKDLIFLVVDENLKFGNGLLLPAGALRETRNSAIKKASAVFCIGSDCNFIKTEKPIFNLKREFTEIPDLSSNYLAFSGLAINSKFHNSLKSLGLKVDEFIEFEDHHNYTKPEIESILKKAEEKNLRIITTEKDIVKIPNEYLRFIHCLKLTLTSERKKDIMDVVNQAM